MRSFLCWWVGVGGDLTLEYVEVSGDVQWSILISAMLSPGSPMSNFPSTGVQDSSSASLIGSLFISHSPYESGEA